MFLQFEMQFVGNVSSALSVMSDYFNTDAMSDRVIDSGDREWIVQPCANKDNSDVSRFVFVTPFLDVSEYNDTVKIHDLLLLFRMTKSISTDDSCRMHINVPAPSDKRKLGLYYEKYVECQYEQAEKFDARVTGPCSDARLYKYDVCGFEIDTINDIIVTLIANYGSLTDEGIDLAERFALNFARVVTHDELQFKAFNSTLDDLYVFAAAEWVKDFIDQCNDTWNNGWKEKYLDLRTKFMSVSTA